MDDLNTYSPTELLKLINDLKVEHDILKEELVNYTYEVDELEGKINKKLELLSNIEKEYITLIEELNNRENNI